MKNRIIKIISFILCIAIIEGQTGINPCEDKKYLQIVEKIDKEGKKSFISKILPRIEVDDTDIFIYRVEGVGLSALAKQYYDDET